MSKLIQHTNHLPEKKLDINSQGGARFFSSPSSGALTIALLSWPSFHQDILDKTFLATTPSCCIHYNLLEKNGGFQNHCFQAGHAQAGPNLCGKKKWWVSHNGVFQRNSRELTFLSPGNRSPKKKARFARQKI